MTNLLETYTFEEKYISNEYGTTTLYLTAPKELVADRYPEAEHATISIEYPTAMRNTPILATVMISPTKDGMDYDWSDYELPYGILESIINAYI